MSWERFQKYYLTVDSLGIALDVSRMNFAEDFFSKMEAPMQKAFAACKELEAGAIANPDEGRMVGHYWLRNPALAPQPELTQAIEETLRRILDFSGKVHGGSVKGSGGAFENLLVIGIGGSALGPQFVHQALGQPGKDKLDVYFFDNTDPDGIDLTLAKLAGKLGRTLAVVISKSGSTPETRNGMIEAQKAWKDAGLDFAKHAVAITGEGSKLDQTATADGWLERFPMWDWVGGRTSELAAVGLLPAALQGLDIEAILSGAKQMDEATRQTETLRNPAAMLALMWFHATGGKGEKDMVILPYKDRLMLFSKYLQQLVMESLGKEKDLDGKTVYQGIAVYGNKGSTDQHAYVQQLREGVNNFFATFIEVLRDREGDSVEVETGTTAGDYLHGFLLGTREALSENGRESITLTVPAVTPEIVGALIALYERAVTFYASLVNINAYHQPGVEAGKKAAASILELKRQIATHLSANAGTTFTPASLAEALGCAEKAEIVAKLLDHLAANGEKGVTKEGAASPCAANYFTKA